MLKKTPYDRLLQIERQVSLADEQRLMSIGVSFLALQTLLRDDWQSLKDQRAVTEMIVRRMFYHYRAQKLLKQLLGSYVAAAGGHVFEHAVAIYLEAYLGQFEGFEVSLNGRFSAGDRKRVQPDIAVTRNGRHIAALEAKAALGFRRDYIDSGKWQERRDLFRKAGFAQSYLVILSNQNWPGFQEEMSAQGIIVLVHKHPNDERVFPLYEDETYRLTHSDEIMHPIEPIFEQIAKGSG